MVHDLQEVGEKKRSFIVVEWLLSPCDGRILVGKNDFDIEIVVLNPVSDIASPSQLREIFQPCHKLYASTSTRRELDDRLRVGGGNLGKTTASHLGRRNQ